MNSASSDITTSDPETYEAVCRDQITEWVASNLGGRVLDITRLERWRPQWKVSYRVGDEEGAVLFRGNRPIAGENDLRFEMEVRETLEANGIRVPHIHGWVASPVAFVMDWIDTEDRAPGMLHTAIDNPTSMSDERWQASNPVGMIPRGLCVSRHGCNIAAS